MARHGATQRAPEGTPSRIDRPSRCRRTRSLPPPHFRSGTASFLPVEGEIAQTRPGLASSLSTRSPALPRCRGQTQAEAKDKLSPGTTSDTPHGNGDTPVRSCTWTPGVIVDFLPGSDLRVRPGRARRDFGCRSPAPTGTDTIRIDATAMRRWGPSPADGKRPRCASTHPNGLYPPGLRRR